MRKLLKGRRLFTKTCKNMVIYVVGQKLLERAFENVYGVVSFNPTLFCFLYTTRIFVPVDLKPHNLQNFSACFVAWHRLL